MREDDDVAAAASGFAGNVLLLMALIA